MDRAHPDLTFSLLPWVLGSWPNQAAPVEIFYTGAALLAARYEMLGLTRILPIDRVWVGVRSCRPGAFGGFHYPGQGYRHLQMGAIITRYGDLTGHSPASPELTALDLLRSYAHDCLHYGTYRRYRLEGGGICRIQYGINFRRPDGRTYSHPDPVGAPSTRNLGIVIEGATDREARAITREAARSVRVGQPPEGTMDYYQFRDVTGALDAEDLMLLEDDRARDAITQGHSPADLFLSNMASYARTVGARYTRFLQEVGSGAAEELHTVILRSMISGRLGPLCRWLNQQHGPRAFTALFKAPGYSNGQVSGAP